MLKRLCPVCQTDEFVICIMGTHAEGRPIIIEDKEKYVQGDCIAHESCECDKCGGEFSIGYEIHDGRIKYLKVDYRGSRADKSGCHTWA